MLGEDGALAGAKSGSVLIDMTTSEPSLAVEIAKRAAERGVASVDAPVSGGDVGAKNGTLSIMIGGDESTVGTYTLDETTHSVKKRDMGVFEYKDGTVTPKAFFGIDGDGFRLA